MTAFAASAASSPVSRHARAPRHLPAIGVREPVRAIVVAIPAHNEEATIHACLVHVLAAARRVPEVTVHVVVALDRCTDATARIVSRFPEVHAVTPIGTGVGCARDTAIRRGLDLIGGCPGGTWVAMTDADTLVPATWFAAQLRLAAAGYDVMVGTVVPFDVTADVHAAWHAVHQLCEDHPHIHGANLGFRADVWRAVGGFGTARLHEDVRLVEAARAAGWSVRATDATRVSSSGRHDNRVDGGFGGYLRALSARLHDDEGPSTDLSPRPAPGVIDLRATAPTPST